jgi:hypothetical protein
VGVFDTATGDCIWANFGTADPADGGKPLTIGPRDLNYPDLGGTDVNTYERLHLPTFLLNARNSTLKARLRASGVDSDTRVAIDSAGVLGVGTGASTLSFIPYTCPI